MMTKPEAVDPIARLSLLQRFKWRLRERRIVEEFHRDQAAALKLIQGNRVLGAVAEKRGALMAVIGVDRRWVTMRGVSDRARKAFVEISRHDCRIDAVGRYRDAWWISVQTDPREGATRGRVIVLASHVTVSEQHQLETELWPNLDCDC